MKALALRSAVAGALVLLVPSLPAAACSCMESMWSLGQWIRAYQSLEMRGGGVVSGRVTRAEVIELGTWQPGSGGPPLDRATIELTMSVDRWLVGGGTDPPAEISYVTTHSDGIMCNSPLRIGQHQDLLVSPDDDGTLRLFDCGSSVALGLFAIDLYARIERHPGGAPSADDPDPDHLGVYAHHVTEAQGIRISHAWTTATDGDIALIYLDVSRQDYTGPLLVGGTAEFATGSALVQFNLPDSYETIDPRHNWGAIDTWPLEMGDFVYMPYGVSLQLSGLTRPLVEGEVLPITLHLLRRTDRPLSELNDLIRQDGRGADLSEFYYEVDIPISVDVLPPGTLDHPHAHREPWYW